jgi:hypothetical protein
MVVKGSYGSCVALGSGNPDVEKPLRIHSIFSIFVNQFLACFADDGSRQDISIHPGGLIKVRTGENHVRIHEVREGLRVHLVSDLREVLPSLEEGGEVLHLPP